MPTGRFVDGLPVGTQIIGPHFEDLTAIRFAQLAEEAAGAFVLPPAFSGQERNLLHTQALGHAISLQVCASPSRQLPALQASFRSSLGLD